MWKKILFAAIFLYVSEYYFAVPILPDSSTLLNDTTIKKHDNQENDAKRFKRMNGKREEIYRWQNKTLPYFINMTYFTNEHVSEIDKAIKVLESVTCVRFVKRSKQSDYVTFTGDTDHCSSSTGRRGGEQFIKLVNSTVGQGCFKVPSILHEIMHSLGFYHIHKGADRDNHIKILWENVVPGKEYKLKKRTDYWALSDFGVGYDVDSILHYSKTAYSKNGKNTIQTIDNSLTNRIGQRKALSKGDIKRINRMYRCKH